MMIESCLFPGYSVGLPFDLIELTYAHKVILFSIVFAGDSAVTILAIISMETYTITKSVVGQTDPSTSTSIDTECVNSPQAAHISSPSDVIRESADLISDNIVTEESLGIKREPQDVLEDTAISPSPGMYPDSRPPLKGLLGLLVSHQRIWNVKN